MSDIPSLDTTLDNAFAAVAAETGAPIGSDERYVRDMPTALTSEHRDFEAEAKAAAKTAKEQGKEQKLDKDGNPIKKSRSEGLDDSLDAAFRKSEEAQKAKPKAEKREPSKGFSKDHENGAEIDRVLDLSFKFAAEKPKPFDRKEFTKPEARKLRDEIKSRYPGEKLSQILQRMEGWETAFKSNPSATREQIMAAYLQVSPQNFDKPADKKDDGSFDAKYSKVEQDVLDLHDLEEYVKKYGGNFNQILRQVVEFDRGMLEDPVGTSARLAANYGAPVTAEQYAQHEHKQREQAVQHMNEERLVTGLGRVVESGKLPGIESMWDQIADTLTSGVIRRTGDEGTDLEAAYWHVKSYAGQSNSDDADAKARSKGTKSISGAPSGAAGARKQRGGNSLDDSIDRAFGGI